MCLSASLGGWRIHCAFNWKLKALITRSGPSAAGRAAAAADAQSHTEAVSVAGKGILFTSHFAHDLAFIGDWLPCESGASPFRWTDWDARSFFFVFCFFLHPVWGGNDPITIWTMFWTAAKISCPCCIWNFVEGIRLLHLDPMFKIMLLFLGERFE